MKDPALEAFVAAVERHLSQRRGREHALVSPEFELARQWFLAGVPLGTVLVGIDEAFAAGGAPTSLTFCRRFVEALSNPARRQ
jgi:hypothetical protein